jgi:hypothetical protein
MVNQTALEPALPAYSMFNLYMLFNADSTIDMALEFFIKAKCTDVAPCAARRILDVGQEESQKGAYM